MTSNPTRIADTAPRFENGGAATAPNPARRPEARTRARLEAMQRQFMQNRGCKARYWSKISSRIRSE
ncbi:hypothetical protein ACRE_052440 [Hapsidospora chrysogenum ATCC 11550]|uniref:Uncharacterized protein n=1 Tax=Hapsidospora chrysogenum (strain ATCC 11550 / CBS 779.69 / DSM 880 / IAM 14645 / JCM 23072 / IMI 49137) TaxID=857340 RepID=A0A086T3N4_HAPC1|nr:hypothetical protein ACRE_052440 [Hapsidospora chrysogenum ATCC 11550]